VLLELLLYLVEQVEQMEQQELLLLQLRVLEQLLGALVLQENLLLVLLVHLEVRELLEHQVQTERLAQPLLLLLLALLA
jgi:hypothetical protein